MHPDNFFNPFKHPENLPGLKSNKLMSFGVILVHLPEPIPQEHLGKFHQNKNGIFRQQHLEADTRRRRLWPMDDEKILWSPTKHDWFAHPRPFPVAEKSINDGSGTTLMKKILHLLALVCLICEVLPTPTCPKTAPAS